MIAPARSLGRVLAIARKEVRQLRRDRLTFGMIIAIPILQLTLFGFAIQQEVRHLRAGVVDLANSQLSRRLQADAEASQAIDIVARVASVEALEVLLRQGRISVGLVIPPDFERRIVRNAYARPDRSGRADSFRSAAQLLIDSSDPATFQAASGLTHLPTGIRQGLEARPSATARGTFELRPYFNPERRSVVQIVPALVGVILTMTMVLFTAVAIVRERERGNLELLITTPLRPFELMVGKIIPYVLIGLIQVALVLAVGGWIFQVPLRGQPGDILSASAIFIVASLSLGLLISTLAKTQFQAFQLTFFAFLPQILLSGFMFPFDAMPEPARWIGEVMPLTHFLRVIRGMILRAASVSDVERDLWPLAIFALVTIGISILRFRKRLD